VGGQPVQQAIQQLLDLEGAGLRLADRLGGLQVELHQLRRHAADTPPVALYQIAQDLLQVGPEVGTTIPRFRLALEDRFEASLQQPGPAFLFALIDQFGRAG
jgi:hypothetical protein